MKKKQKRKKYQIVYRVRWSAGSAEQESQELADALKLTLSYFGVESHIDDIKREIITFPKKWGRV